MKVVNTSIDRQPIGQREGLPGGQERDADRRVPGLTPARRAGQRRVADGMWVTAMGATTSCSHLQGSIAGPVCPLPAFRHHAMLFLSSTPAHAMLLSSCLVQGLSWITCKGPSAWSLEWWV